MPTAKLLALVRTPTSRLAIRCSTRPLRRDPACSCFSFTARSTWKSWANNREAANATSTQAIRELKGLIGTWGTNLPLPLQLDRRSDLALAVGQGGDVSVDGPLSRHTAC